MTDPRETGSRTSDTRNHATRTRTSASGPPLASGRQLWRLNELGLLYEALGGAPQIEAQRARLVLSAAAARGEWEGTSVPHTSWDEDLAVQRYNHDRARRLGLILDEPLRLVQAEERTRGVRAPSDHAANRHVLDCAEESQSSAEGKPGDPLRLSGKPRAAPAVNGSAILPDPMPFP